MLCSTALVFTGLNMSETEKSKGHQISQHPQERHICIGSKFSRSRLKTSFSIIIPTLDLPAGEVVSFPSTMLIGQACLHMLGHMEHLVISSGPDILPFKNFVIVGSLVNIEMPDSSSFNQSHLPGMFTTPNFLDS